MAKRYRAPWWVSQRWHVETPSRKDPSVWVVIYATKTKKQARKDAAGWTAETGQKTRVVPGAGHASRRGR